MASGVFISRDEKASWGIACNEKADGTLWVGKGSQKSLSGQLGQPIHTAVLAALRRERGERYGRFWVDVEDRKVTMAVGESASNEYKTVQF